MRPAHHAEIIHFNLSELSAEEFALLDIQREEGPKHLLRRLSCPQCFGLHEPEEGCVYHAIDGAIG